MKTLWIDFTGLLPFFESSPDFEGHELSVSQELVQARFFLEHLGGVPAVHHLSALNRSAPSVVAQERLMAWLGRAGQMPVTHTALPLEGKWLTLRADWACPLLTTSPLHLERLMLIASPVNSEWLYASVENLSAVPLPLRASDWWLPVSRYTLDSAERVMEFHWGHKLRPAVCPLSILGETTPDFESLTYSAEELLAFREPAKALLRMKSHLLWHNHSFPAAA